MLFFLILNLVIIVVIILVVVYIKSFFTIIFATTAENFTWDTQSLLQLHTLFRNFIAKKMEWKIVVGTLFSLKAFEEIMKCVIIIFMQ